MPPETSPRYAHIAYDTHQPSAGSQNPEDMPPDFFQLDQETLVILDVSELIRVLVIALQIPIGGGEVTTRCTDSSSRNDRSRASPLMSL